MRRQATPKERSMTTTSARNQRPFVLLPSGRVIDLADPLPSSWTDEDLAIGLSRTYRWGGHSHWSRPLTVAQHSLTVLAIRLLDEPHLSPSHCLYELLHDAEEGLIGFDCIAPLKAYLGRPFGDLCGRLTAAIAQRYDLPTLTAPEYCRHKRADRIAAASEARHVTSWSDRQIADTLQLVEEPANRDPLMRFVTAGDYAEWEPWAADFAAGAWFDALTSAIMARDGGAVQ